MIIRFDKLSVCGSFDSWLYYTWDYNTRVGKQKGFRFFGVRVELGFVPEYLR